MATKANIIKIYAQADSAKKVDIIIRYYPNLMGIVESYTDGLRYMIENEKAFLRNKGFTEQRESLRSRWLDF